MGLKDLLWPGKKETSKERRARLREKLESHVQRPPEVFKCVHRDYLSVSGNVVMGKMAE